jgi:hypothetical protein
MYHFVNGIELDLVTGVNYTSRQARRDAILRLRSLTTLYNMILYCLARLLCGSYAEPRSTATVE